MTKHINSKYSTTRQLSCDAPSPSVTAEERFGILLRLPEGGVRKAEGGLRTKSLFKKPTPDSPVVTVVTVVFNNSAYIERTISSVLEQTYDNVEYIVIDGGSTDGTLEIIRQYDDKIDYWVSEPDRGLYDAMNKAISVASGQWLNFMNSGDVFVDQNALNRAMAFCGPGADVIYSDHYRYNESVGITRKITCEAERLYLLHQSLVYRRSLHHIHGPYLVKPGLLISDYLFFNLLDRDSFVKSPHPISNNLEGGISTDLSHVREKNAVDYLFGNTNLMRMAWITLRERYGRSLPGITNLLKRKNRGSS
ncbi:glycosyltransferase family 2 protein [Seongchinamella unica]|uniref:glycosyltransferase family 2 protein n=1 Tax=Seongchinamella unica TaxID=2547392 RepID=UPI001EED3D2D|nr:glycosyltransferase family 2 protein [Seongchinamella unica]